MVFIISDKRLELNRKKFILGKVRDWSKKLCPHLSELRDFLNQIFRDHEKAFFLLLD